ncbi:MAG: hypothetical protein OXC25_08340 [Thiotrichales bacterium]|nr:hypothetical protein [Thiotrichales bacterium]MCY4283843.1 hypothetical protein [Thiotrichales bacterium]MCY4349843.1 hypothetical protein [Thiotrichales bacterium]
MEIKATIITAALALAGLQIGLFAWLKADIGALGDRMVMVEREVAFMRGQFSVAFPTVKPPKTTGEGGSE